MSHPQLTIADRQSSGADVYEKIVVRIATESQYNAAKQGTGQGLQYAFEGIDGYWERKGDLSQPVVGQVYEVLLSTKAKQNGNGDYQDIRELRGPAPEGTPLTELGPRAPQSNGSAPAAQQATGYNYPPPSDKDAKITRAVVANDMVAMVGHEIEYLKLDFAVIEPDKAERLDQLIALAYEAIQAVQADLPKPGQQSPSLQAEDSPPPTDAAQEPEAEAETPEELPW